VRTAADSLALGREGLKERLFTALFCLAFCDEREVPGLLRPDFDSIREEVFRRAGIRGSDATNATMRDADYRRLRRSVLRCNVRTAERVARIILEMDRYLGAQKAIVERVGRAPDAEPDAAADKARRVGIG
jgi:hypothetical protein